MFARRVTALVLTLLMGHLSLVGADLACAQHGMTAAHAQASGEMHESHDMSRSHAAGGVNADRTPCETPAQPTCCTAMSSCAVSATLAHATPADLPALVRALVDPAAIDAPLSTITTPDPPPPKA